MRWAAIVMIAGCSATTADPPPPAAANGARFDDCAEDSVPILGGGCKAIGVRECGKGFAADGKGGCTANVPACAVGTLATLGEAACHEVMECGPAPYGEVPSGAVVFVNAAFTGTSDGTRDKPFTTIQAAVTAAPRDATIAVADGVYNESVTLLAPVVLRGRCPSKVEIRGTGARAIAVRSTAEIRGVAVTGAGQGVTVDGSNVKLDQLWVHDTAGSGVFVQSPAAGVVLSRSLVEKVRTTGAYVEGAALRVESSVIRDVSSAADGRGGNGVQAQIGRDGKPSTVAVAGTIVERVVASAILNYGSDVTIDGSLLRDVVGRDDVASCVHAQKGSVSDRLPQITIGTSLLERCTGTGVNLVVGTLSVDRSVIRDSKPHPVAKGLGLLVVRGALTVRDSFVSTMPLVGIQVFGGTAAIERTIVRDTGGIGIALAKYKITEQTSATVTDSAVLHTSTVGIYAGAAKVDVLRSLVRDVKPEPGTGLYGDGIEAAVLWGTVENAPVGAEVLVSETVVRDAARAGLAVLASSGVVEKASLGCTTLDLAVGRSFRRGDGTLGELEFTLDDRGGNVCGCPAKEACRATQSAIEPVSFAP